MASTRRKPKAPLTLADAVARLSSHAGKLSPPPTENLFEAVLWENVAYLASRERREAAFAELKFSVGTSPADILAAKPAALKRVTAHGILKDVFAKKLVACARLARDEYGGDLEANLPADPAQAKRALRKFPGIGEPGADKILLFSGSAPSLAPESNGVRVLIRLGLVEEGASYAKSYSACRAAGVTLGKRDKDLQQAHLQLHHHGQTLCKRTAPRCGVCPLKGDCRYAKENLPA